MTQTATGMLYVSAEKIYPRTVHGQFARLRVIAMLGLLGSFYLLPWLSWGDRPLVQFDLPARKFYVFWLTLFPQDLYLLTGLLAIAAMTLFLLTSLAGRLFCGYACPQTVWTEAFLWMERFAEGDRNARIKLDQSPWNARKLLRKGGKHVLWVLFAAWTGLTFVSYFQSTQIFTDLAQGSLGGWPLFWSAFYGFATWGNAGFMREQVCRYMCPYARFQSAMFDRDTLLISYDRARGEPRRTLAKKQGVPAGDCVACNICVQVCPTGIDIRNGLQYECIACAACADACDDVMDKIGKPRGLIRYSSLRRDEEGRFHVLRPRTFGYALVWLLIVGAFFTALADRDPVSLSVIRDRHALYRHLADGHIENLYTLKLTNKSDASQVYDIYARLDNGDPVRLSSTRVELNSNASKALVVAATVLRPASSAAATMGIHFTAVAEGDENQRAQQDARFILGTP